MERYVVNITAEMDKEDSIDLYDDPDAVADPVVFTRTIVAKKPRDAVIRALAKHEEVIRMYKEYFLVAHVHDIEGDYRGRYPISWNKKIGVFVITSNRWQDIEVD